MESYTNYTETSRMNTEAYVSARERVKSLLGFYKHLAAYVLVNLFISITAIYEAMEAGFTLKSALSDGDVYTLWIIWGIGLAIHGLNVFSFIGIFNHKWEERKIKEYMEEDTRNWK